MMEQVHKGMLGWMEGRKHEQIESLKTNLIANFYKSEK